MLCVERLSHGINSEVKKGRWQPVRLNRNGVPLTHLFFTDDLLLLSAASLDQAQVISEVLDFFCLASGEKVSKEKINIYFSKIVRVDDRREIVSELGFYVIDNLGNYLGVPLLHNRVNKHTYKGVLDKVQQRLTGWNALNLYLAGRVMLVVEC